MAINVADYNGMTFATARAWIINKACDYVMHTYYPHQNEHDVIVDANMIGVNVLSHTVNFPNLTTTLQ